MAIEPFSNLGQMLLIYRAFHDFSSWDISHLPLRAVSLRDLGTPRRDGKSPREKKALWETVPWETACRAYPGQTDSWLRLGPGVGLSSITGHSF